ncbi:putative hydro-lyase [Bacillus sp. JJ1532]|uniref:putative hydro-lyase n=1 Tax=Bacillus sp. JJ1532 TaxID=3122958 RepID=UPI002FFDDE91
MKLESLTELSNLTPSEARSLIRENKLNRPTYGIASGFTQANLVVLRKEAAFEFLLFCQRNQKPCPILDVTEGSPHPKLVAPNADIRTDLGRYRIYREGELVDEVTDILKFWEDDMVAFLIGCSFTFERALLSNGIPLRHMELGSNVAMYKTNIECVPAGRFAGPTVVSMRPIPEKDVVRAVQVTSRFPATHGAPLHIGSPESIGIRDINKPDFGDALPIRDGEVPVFWACGVTPQAVAMQVKPEIMITHAPGCMFITDWEEERLTVL